MQSALVRQDPVMVHDPLRTHTRATVVGICITLIGMAGFFIWGLLSPPPTTPNENGKIIIAEGSGTLYVLFTEPRRQLVPTFNLASARLLLAAHSQASGGAAAEPEVVKEEQLRDIPRGRLTGIVDGPELLPKKEERISDHWAVCDEYAVQADLNDPTGANRITTTVLAGVGELGEELRESDALLVRSDSGEAYLVYRKSTTSNIRNADTVRAKVDLEDLDTTTALGLNSEEPRRITTGTLNAIPEDVALAPPPIPSRGEPSAFAELTGLTVGTVFKVERAGQQDFDYWVVLRDGIQKIKFTTAELIRHQTDGAVPEIAIVPPKVTAQVPNLRDQIQETSFPDRIPQVLKEQNFPVACLGWSTLGTGDQAEEHTSVHVGRALPMPKDGSGSPYQPIRVSSPNAGGLKIDQFFMTPGRAAVVRAASATEKFRTGPIYLVSDRGVTFGVPDQDTAAVLGLADQSPAPISIVGLLPSGASLNTVDVKQTYDSVPVGAGVFDEEDGK